MNNWKTFVVKFDDHLGKEKDVKVIVKARNEYEAISKALLPARTLNPNIVLHVVCDHCGDYTYHANAYSRQIAGDYFDSAEYANDIRGLKESTIKNVLAIGFSED